MFSLNMHLLNLLYIPYLNKLVDQFTNTYHHYNKKSIDIDYSGLTEKFRQILDLLNLK